MWTHHANHRLGEDAWAEHAVRALRSWHCPACPSEHLERVEVQMFRPQVSGRCDCCGSLWVLTDEGPLLLEQGPQLQAVV